MKNFFKFLVILLILPSTLFAKSIRQKSLDFNIDTAEIYNGNILYSSKLLDSSKFNEKFKKIHPLDLLAIRKLKDRKILIIRSSFMVKVAPGFLNQDNLLDENFISHLQDGAKVSKISDDTFKISSIGTNFEKTIYFDSDDISSLDSKKFSNALNTVKEIDVQSQSSIATLIEKDTIGKDGGVIIQSFIPLKKDKTLIIRYELISLPANAEKKSINKAIPNNLEKYQKLFESFNNG